MAFEGSSVWLFLIFIDFHSCFCSGILKMGDPEAEPNNPDFELATLNFKLRISARGIAISGTVGLAAFYLSSPENEGKVVAALCYALERVGETEVVNIIPGSLVVELHCSSSKCFLVFWNDYQSGSVKKRLSEEFSKIGIKGDLTVEIENEEEVTKVLR